MPNFKTLETVDFIVVHCSATPEGREVTAEEIDRWHRERGFLSIGYHRVIRLDGSVEEGRPLDRWGAHARGYNHRSIGVCLIGGVSADDITVAQDTFTPAQKTSLYNLLTHDLLKRFPNAKVLGHRDLDKSKACPSFDVRKWFEEMNDALHYGAPPEVFFGQQTLE